jgi:hypothetical protein
METNKKSKLVTNNLLTEIKSALQNIKGWGSVEIFVQNGCVTQITQRSIKKTNHDIHETLN